MQAEAVAEKVLLLTYSILDASLQEDPSEMTNLLEQRQQAIAELETLPMTDRAKQSLDETIALDAKLMESLQNQHELIRSILAEKFQERKALRGYGTRP